MVIVCLQTSPERSPEATFLGAEAFALQGEQLGPEILVFPERFAAPGGPRALTDGPPTGEFLSRLAKKLELFVLGGSHAEHGPWGTHHTAPLVAPTGECQLSYRQMHLPPGLGERWQAGTAPGIFTLRDQDSVQWQCRIALGQDLLYPEVFRGPAGEAPELIFILSASDAFLGVPQWEALVQARAIENQAFVIACNQAASEDAPGGPFGHSMIVGPWGELLGHLGEAPGVLHAKLHKADLKAARKRWPLTQVPAS